jgi:hypothetical protein
MAAKITFLSYFAQAQKPVTITILTHKHGRYLNLYLIINYDLKQLQNEILTVNQFVYLLVFLAGGHKGNKNNDIVIRQLRKGLNFAKIVL